MAGKTKKWLMAAVAITLSLAVAGASEAKGKKSGKSAGDTVKGTLASVDTGSISVTAGKHKKKGGGGTTQTIKTNAKTVVKVDGAPSTLAGLTTGMKVSVREAGGAAKEIDATLKHKKGKKKKA